MVNLLLKIFVKDYQNTSNQKVRTKYGILGASFGLVTNSILFVSKLIIGLIFANVSIIADALNNLSDFGNCFLTIFGFKLSSKPADVDHPYGHQRMEYIISMVISVIIIALGVEIGVQAVQSIINPEPAYKEFPLIPVIVLDIAMLIKVLQSIVYYSLGRRINSLVLKASGADARNDVLATGSVLIGVFVSFYTGFVQIDGILAIAVALFILYTGIKILFQTGDVLLGEKPSQETIDTFVHFIRNSEGVLGVHDLEMHCYGPNAIFASIHCEIDGSKDIYETHDNIDNIETACMRKFGIKTVIHMDPIKVNDKETERVRKIVADAIEKTSSHLSFHDFRIVSGPTHINAVFDMVLPFDLKKDRNNLMAKIRNEVKQADPNIRLVVNFDDEYEMISSEND